MHAVNLCDWMTNKDDFVLRLLLEPIVERRVIECECQRSDGMALPLLCDETRANAIVTLIRRRFHRNEFRIYQSKTGRGGWERI